MQRLSWSVGRALARSGIRPGDKVAVLSGNDPVAFGAVFGISRAGAVWCPVNPRNEAAENRELLALLDCRCLIFAAAFAPLVAKIAPDLPELTTLVCLATATSQAAYAGAAPCRPARSGSPSGWPGRRRPWQADPVDDVVMIAGTGGTTGRPKGVMLTGRNVETMAALTLMSYPFAGSPVYLAFAPLTHAAGVLCFPIMALGGEIVIMPQPRPRGVPRAHRAAPRHATRSCPRPSSTAARPPGAGAGGPGLACSACGTGRRRCRRPGSSRRSASSDRSSASCSARPRRR